MTREEIKQLAEQQFPNTEPKDRVVKVDCNLYTIFKNEIETAYSGHELHKSEKPMAGLRWTGEIK